MRGGSNLMQEGSGEQRKALVHCPYSYKQHLFKTKTNQQTPNPQGTQKNVE